MTGLLDCPQDERGTLRFRLFGIPVRVLPWFWLTTLFTGASQDTTLVLMWIAVVFVSIVIHELGHVLAFRAFGVEGEIVLYNWGGLAVPVRGRLYNTFQQVVVSAAGPVAGFGLAACAVPVAAALGAHVLLTFHTLVIPSLTVHLPRASEDWNSYYWNVLLNDLLWVNLYWGLVNLLPVLPLDGGHISEALFQKREGYRGKRKALMLSGAVAATVAVLGLASHSLYLALVFGMLAAGSLQKLEALKPLYPRRSYESWRR
jgi:stage IV sporulation protein FB